MPLYPGTQIKIHIEAQYNSRFPAYNVDNLNMMKRKRSTLDLSRVEQIGNRSAAAYKLMYTHITYVIKDAQQSSKLSSVQDSDHPNCTSEYENFFKPSKLIVSDSRSILASIIIVTLPHSCCFTFTSFSSLFLLKLNPLVQP